MVVNGVAVAVSFVRVNLDLRVLVGSMACIARCDVNEGRVEFSPGNDVTDVSMMSKAKRN